MPHAISGRFKILSCKSSGAVDSRLHRYFFERKIKSVLVKKKDKWLIIIQHNEKKEACIRMTYHCAIKVFVFVAVDSKLTLILTRCCQQNPHQLRINI